MYTYTHRQRIKERFKDRDFLYKLKSLRYFASFYKVFKYIQHNT